MIIYKTGNLLDVVEGVIIHGCNAQGVMGSGVALAIKEKYPDAYRVYKDFEAKHGLKLGSISLRGMQKHTKEVKQNLWIANAITQEFYGSDSTVQYVSYGSVHLAFEKLHKHFPAEVPFHFPKIGAGRGNGDWLVISQLIELACPYRELVCWEL